MTTCDKCYKGNKQRNMIDQGIKGGYWGDWELILWKNMLKLTLEEWEGASRGKSWRDYSRLGKKKSAKALRWEQATVFMKLKGGQCDQSSMGVKKRSEIRLEK